MKTIKTIKNIVFLVNEIQRKLLNYQERTEKIAKGIRKMGLCYAVLRKAESIGKRRR